ncbi:hypothetical protein [Aquiflexum sp.]|uniref:hypothetical protein n=1 Tax=Aquiflexum sp. TaxID=1872584 RepID=UPI0035941871
MENLSIHHLAMFMDSEIFILPEEKKIILDKKPNSLPYPEQNQELSLVEEDSDNESLNLDYEGGFGKGVLIVYQGKTLDPNLHELLFKILNAVGCSLKDIALASSEAMESTSLTNVMSMNPNKIIVFGNFRHDIMMHKKSNYEIINYEGVEYLFADDLKILFENTNLKKSLWTELQVLFNITKKQK